MSETEGDTPLNGEPLNGEPLPGEPQTEEELERLIDKELEDVGKEEQTPAKEKGDLDARQREVDKELKKMREEQAIAEEQRKQREQQAIDEELRKLREELLADSPSPDDLTMDIASRVKQLNEELAKEGPVEEKKNRKVNFPEDIVSMAVEPPEYTEDEIAAADEEAGKLDGSENDMQSENSAPQETGPEEASSNSNGQELKGAAPDDADGGRPSARQGWREMENSSQGSQPAVKESSHELEQITGAPVNPAPNRTDETDSAMSSESQSEPAEQRLVQPVHQEQAVAGTDTEEGSAGTGNDDMDSKNASDPSDPNDLEVERLTLRPQQEHRTFKSQGPGQDMTMDQGQGSSNGLKEVSEDEHILIERGGKFDYVSVQDLSPEERESLGVTLKKQPRNDGSQLPSLQPKPPQKARPSTATGGESRSPQQRRLPPRAMSAKTSKEHDRQERMNASYEDLGNQKSRYGMTPEQKQHRRDQARLKAQRLKEEKDREEQERREKEEMCEGVFKAWCEQKKQENAQKKQEEKERKKTEQKEEKPSEEAFEAWLHRKKEQKKVEGKVKNRLSEEEREAYFMRSRDDCERAFKRWVRAKNAGLKDSHSMSRAGALESKKRAQQSRKSRNLAKALEVAQAYRYSEYYGYRF